MATHLFVCGHGEIDPGAGGNGITERDWTRNPLIVSVKKWAEKLKKNKIEIFSTAQNMYYQTQKGWGAYSVSASYASVTELHLDASSNGNTSGGHVIISSKFSPDTYDKALAKVVKSFCGWHPAFTSDGISRRSDLLNLNVFAKRGISYRLIELGFITSKKDTDELKKNYDALGKALVEAVTGETISGTAPAPAPSTGLKVGDTVKVTGNLFADADGKGASSKSRGKSGKIDKVANGKKKPFHVTGLGWAAASDITDPTTKTVTIDTLNVYTTQSLNSKIVRFVKKGDKVKVTATAKGQSVHGSTSWSEVDKYGWVPTVYLK